MAHLARIRVRVRVRVRVTVRVTVRVRVRVRVRVQVRARVRVPLAHSATQLELARKPRVPVALQLRHSCAAGPG